MNVLADLHHGDLYHSLRMLFEKRLGWNLYRPIGIDWYTKGFWQYNNNLPTVKQYLDIRGEDKDQGDHFLCPEGPHGEVDKALTFSQFLEKDIDIVIASVREHEDTYHRLIQEHKPKAKLIRQCGNIHDVVDPQIIKNIMASCCLSNIPPNVNAISYHQEFDLKVFKPSFETPDNKIKNFMNCVPDSRDFYLWPRYKAELENFDFKMFGILGDDGIIGNVQEIADKMRDSTFIWHVKFGGDGFGHVIHNAFAVGTPIITRASYYKNCLAEPLLVDGETCIDLDKGSFEENISKIKALACPVNNAMMRKNTYNKFKQCVDFDKEFKIITKFLENLK